MSTSTSEPRRTTRSKAAAPAKSSADKTPSEADVARRAYELYLSRGCEDGHDREDWLRAEAELRGEPGT
jgi:hypothetical protein